MTRRTGLGRGLDALLPSDGGAIPEAREGPLREVPVDRIDPNPRQPRRTFDPGRLEELGESIRTLGVLQPLLVRAAPAGRFELIAGERRLRAATNVGAEVVPVLVVDTDERGSLERALVENVHRQDLNPIEEAAGYKQLMEESGLTQEALGERVGRNRATIANAMRLLDLPISIQRYLVEGRITAGHARALLALQNSPFQERMATRIAQEGLSVREAEDQVRRYQAIAAPGPAAARASERPAIASEAERRLRDRLQTKVRVQMGKRKGKIVVDFASADDLERLMDVMTGEADGGTSTTVRPE